MKKKTVSTLVWILAAALALTACWESKPSGQDSSGKPAVAESGQPNSSGTPEPIKISINTIDPKFTWENNVAHEFQKRTGVEMEYLQVVGDLTQKLDLWLAGGDYPDIVVMQPKNMGKYRDAGAIIPLEDLIDQYGPNIKKAFGKYYDLLRDADGHIYSLAAPVLADETPADWEGYFAVQYDVLREAGYPEIKTLDQLYDVIKAYYEKHPTIDGQPTIPFGGMGGADNPDYILNNPAFMAAGKPDHSWFSIDGGNNVTMNVTADFTKRYYRFLNKLYNAGMLDQEFFTLNTDSAEAKLAQGRVLAGWLPAWFTKYPEQSLRTQGKFERQFANLEILFDKNTEDHTNTITPINSNNNWHITKNAKNPKRIIQYVDYLFTDAGQKLLNWGIEGKHYDVVNGKRVVNAEWEQKKAADPEYEFKDGPSGVFYWFTFGNGAKLSDGDYATPLTKEYWHHQYDQATKDLLAKYSKQTFADFMPKPEVVPAWIWQLAEPTKGRAEMKRVQQVYKKESPRIIFSKTAEEFDKNWNSYVEQVDKAGVKMVESAYTKVWKDYMEKFNKVVR